MFDAKKIDSYFDSPSSFDNYKDDSKNKRAMRVRLVKLLLPCLAAIIFGLMILLPYMKNTQTPLNFDVTMPKKGELEKLHMENTKFNITDADNKITNFTADNIDETEPQSKVIKLVNPKGKIPLKNGGFAHIESPSGFFDQANNKITMLEDVFINYNDETEIKTKNAIYNFNTHKGQGSSPISANGIYGKLSAQSYEADTKNEVYILYGNSMIDIKRKNENILVKSNKKMTLYKAAQKAIAEGNASLSDGKNTIYANKIEADYVEINHQPEITEMRAFVAVKMVTPRGTVHADQIVYTPKKAIAEGNVSVNDGENTIYAKRIEADYTEIDNQKEIKEIRAYGAVRILTLKGTAYADKAIYTPKNGVAELFDNVIIEQNKNKIFGDYAITNTNTGISKVMTNNLNKRVHGTFKNIKKSKKKEGK